MYKTLEIQFQEIYRHPAHIWTTEKVCGLQDVLMLHSNWKTNCITARPLLNVLGLEKITDTSIKNWREIQDHLNRDDYKIL